MNYSNMLPEGNSPLPNRLQGIERPVTSHSTERKAADMEHFIARSDWLSSAILHDLRNPVATIYASTEMLMHSDLGPSETKRLAVSMHSAAARIRKLLAEVSSATFENKSAPEICDVSEVITAAAEAAFASTEHLNVRVHIERPRASKQRWHVLE